MKRSSSSLEKILIESASNEVDEVDADPLDPLVPLETTKNAYVDKITMELLLNKNHYSKYLSKTDPAKYDEYREFKNKLQKYSEDIIDMTSQLIENPKMTITNDISENFDIYIKSVLRYLEMKEMEQRDEREDDMMFPPNAMEERPLLVKKHDDNQDNGGQEDEKIGHSFWGKHRVKKMSSYDLSMFSSNFPK